MSKLRGVLVCCEGFERHEVSVCRKVFERHEVSVCRKMFERHEVHFLSSQMLWGLRLS